MKIQIKARFTGSVLFEHEAEGNTISITLQAAVNASAYLARANLDGAYLAGERPVFQVGPIGSRCAYLVSFLTTVGVKIRAGCFFGSRDEFAAKVEKEHGDSIHGEEYRAALTLIDAHARLWSKAETVAEAELVESHKGLSQAERELLTMQPAERLGELSAVEQAALNDLNAKTLIPFRVTVTTDDWLEMVNVLAPDACSANTQIMEILFGDFDASKPKAVKVKVEPVNNG